MNLTRFTAAFLLSLVASRAFAQAPVAGAAERLRLVTNEARQRDARSSAFLEMAKQEEYQHNAGGWVTITGIDLRDDDHDSATPDAFESVVLEDYRVWVAGEISESLKYYVRGRKLDFDFDTAVGVPGPDFKSQEKATLDQGYLDWAFADHWSLRAGRQFSYVGRALVLSADLDGGLVTYNKGPWQHRIFAGKSIDRDPNLDTSIVGFARETQDRSFYFAESSHTFESGTRVYAYGMAQQDDSRSLSPVQQARDFAYNSLHGGLGAEGRFDPKLHYYVEYTHQGGSMLADAPNTRVDIDANALLAGLLYYPDMEWHPLVTLELAHGSGDPARTSVTNTFGGKLSATADTNFMYFGSYDGGLALSPRLSNLNVMRFGYQVKPRPKESRILPGLILGGKLSGYWKDEENGVISDPLATLADTYVGWGADLFVGWRPLSDFSVFAQVGRFDPGSAFAAGADDATNRTLLTSTLSF